VNLEGEKVWLHRLQLSELFGRDVKTKGKYIYNTLKDRLNGETLTGIKFAIVLNI